MKKNIATTLAIIILCLGGFLFMLNDHSHGNLINRVNEDFPDISKYEILNGAIEDYNKPALVIVFAHWCPYCMAAIPILNQLHKQYKHEINIIGLSLEKNDVTYELAKNNIDYPVIYEKEASFASYFQVSTIPFYAIKSKDNKVLWQGNDFKPSTLKHFFVP